MKQLILLLCIPLFFFSCSKKELEEVEVAPAASWELHEQFLHSNRFISNLYATNEDLYVLGIRLFSKISHTSSEESVEHYYHGLHNVANYKYPINENVFVEAEGQYIKFVPNQNPTTFTSDLKVNMVEIDPNFKSFQLMMSNRNEAIGLLENNVALVPYYAYDAENDLNSRMKLLLVKFSMEREYYHFENVALVETKILNFLKKGITLHYVSSFDNYFYLSTSDGFYKISETGEIDLLLPDQGVHTMFRHKGSLYAITWNGPRQTTSLYKAAAGGDWILVANLGSRAEFLFYAPVSDDLLLGSYNNQLFQVEIGQDTFTLRELENTGLEGHFVTAMAVVKDKVYMATHSGLFSKDAEHLLTYKKEE